MRIRTQIALAAVVLFGVAYGGAIWLGHSRSGQDDTPPLQRTDTLVQRGEYVAWLADCFACHTAPKGRLYAGGLAMQTPLGAVYSTNITPDKETGIGRYTYTQFRAAVQHGIRADGTPLYPAMPYPSYVIMPDEDIQALYAYFMHGVQPVSQRNADSTLPPVLNWRRPLAYWQLLFAPERTFAPAPSTTPASTTANIWWKALGTTGRAIRRVAWPIRKKP